jgi:hypothetical protein
LGFEQRFLAKIALSLGYNLLGADFLRAWYTASLRKVLWEKDPKKRASYGVRGSGFYEQDKLLNKIISWEGGYTFLLKRSEPFLSFGFSLFGKAMLNIAISEDAELTKLSDIKDTIYVLVPQIGRFEGPFELEKYIACKQGIVRIAELDDLKSRCVDLKTLPPFKRE